MKANFASVESLKKQAQNTGKRLMRTFENGLVLRCAPAGLCSWLFRVRSGSNIITETLGKYPDMSIAAANAEAAKRYAEHKQAPCQQSHITLNEVYKAWGEKKAQTAVTWRKIDLVCRKHLLRKFGSMPLEDLTAPMLIKHWEPLEKAGLSNTLQKLCQYVKQIAVFAVNTGRVERIHELTKISQNYVFKAAKSYPAPAPEDLWEVFYTLEKEGRSYDQVWDLFMASFYTLSRPGEVCAIKWEWVDLDAGVINFPAEVMKMKRAHTVPISSQLKALLVRSERLSEWVFTSPAKIGQHINRESVRMMLKRKGLSGTLTAHGIRSIGRTWMEQQGVNHDTAEACLAHYSGNRVIKAYVRYDYLKERREIMQKWCDFVDQSREKAQIKIRNELTKKPH